MCDLMHTATAKLANRLTFLLSFSSSSFFFSFWWLFQNFPCITATPHEVLVARKSKSETSQPSSCSFSSPPLLHLAYSQPSFLTGTKRSISDEVLVLQLLTVFWSSITNFFTITSTQGSRLQDMILKQKDIPLSLKYDNFFVIFHPFFSYSSSSSSCSSLFSSLIIVLTFFFVILHYHRWIEGLEEFPLQLYPGLAQLMNRSSSDGKGDSDMSMHLTSACTFSSS